MNYLLSPLSKQADNGFGLVADAFKEAAEKLHEAGAEGMNAQLPIAFLYRHSVELYLKSGIIAFFRRFKLQNRDGTTDLPKIDKNAKDSVSIYNCHDIALLFAHWKRLLAEQEEFLQKHTKTNWKLPDNLDGLVAAAHALDRKGTFFRYPCSDDSNRDESKFQVKPTTPAEIMERQQKGENVKVMICEAANGEIAYMAALDSGALASELKALAELSEFLSCAHVAIRCEVCGGN